MSSPQAVRAPAVAGTFYPASPQALARAVDDHLRSARRHDGRGVKALIAPHAGYAYSGPVAASAYAVLAGRATPVRRVVLLGPAHRVPLRGMAVPSVDGFATPLGTVPVDAEARARAVTVPGVSVDDRPHAPEHALEVHLPFLQRALGPTGWAVLPVVVGDAGPEEVAALLDALWGDEGTLVVVSTDLSHYHDHATAQRLDARTVEAIVAGDLERIADGDACGARPLRGLLLACRERGLQPELLDRRTSGDTAGDHRRVVGYAALVVREPQGAEHRADTVGLDESVELDAAARRTVTATARAAVEHRVDPSRPAPDLEAGAASPALRRPGASFVTLRSADGALRGCIGSIEPTRPLLHDVADNAVRAATADPRFPPIAPNELDGLQVKVSVLSPLVPMAVRSREDLRHQVVPGVDGLLVEAGRHRGTFLPSVWEQLPGVDEFLDHLWGKAGLAPGSWPSGLQVHRYRALDLA